MKFGKDALALNTLAVFFCGISIAVAWTLSDTIVWFQQRHRKLFVSFFSCGKNRKCLCVVSVMCNPIWNIFLAIKTHRRATFSSIDIVERSVVCGRVVGWIRASAWNECFPIFNKNIFLWK